MGDTYDVVIVGGAVIGSAVAYYLTADPAFDGRVLVVERDPSYARAATGLSASGIRTQFSNAINVKISQYGLEVILDFAATMGVEGTGPDLHFHPGGYLYLAASEPAARVLRENHAVQQACGADVVLWDRAELAKAFPHLNVEDIELAAYGRSGEGWFDNAGLMQGFRAKARAQGAKYVTDEVVGLTRAGGRVTGVTLKAGGTVAAGAVVNASGARGAQVARMAGLDLPVEPRKRTVFVFDCAQTPQGSANVNEGRLPLMIDTSGVYCRPEGNFFLSGASPLEDPAVDWDDFDPRHNEFEDIIWPALAARSPAFEAIKPKTHWAGQYDYNTLDQNLVVGPHPECPNFICANGFSGHGLQQAPATGRGVAEMLVHGRYLSLDLSELGVERIVENRPFLEKAII
jgi:glycine/D-amino acid oxidase-like deaminating enzyme